MFRIILSGAVALAAAVASAHSITPAQALERLQAEGPDRTVCAASVNSSLTLAAEQPGIYIFTAPEGGFVVTSADTNAPALIGYGDSFDPDNIPPALQGYLSAASDQIEKLAHNPLPLRAKAQEDHPTVPALCTTKWNQGDPYNSLCPTDPNTGRRSVTGCVATAMAQVIKYHNYPETTGYGTFSYELWGQELSFDYGNTVFNWRKMPNVFSSGNTGGILQSPTAVATLMRACGIGVRMRYSSSASGAFSIDMPRALYQNFGYDKGIRYLMRDGYFETDEWDEIVYAEIAAKRPVLYCGQSQQGGHAFVCDGYAGNGFYHINWGWGGSSDGNFLLSVLDPYTQGIGGSGNGSGFNTDQDITIGIRPPVEGSQLFLPLYAEGAFCYLPEKECFSFSDEGGYWNLGADTIHFNMGVRLVDCLNDSVVYYAVGTDVITIDPVSIEGEVYYAEDFTAAMPQSLPAGSYDGYPVCRPVDGTEWQQVFVPLGMPDHILIRKGENGHVTYDGSDPDLGWNIITSPTADDNAPVPSFDLLGRRLDPSAPGLHITSRGKYLVK